MIDFDDSDLESQYEDRHTDYQDEEYLPHDIPFGDDDDEKRHMMVKDLYEQIEKKHRTAVWLAPNGDWLEIDVIVPDEDGVIIISEDDTQTTLKMTDMITVRFPFGWDDEDLTDTQEVEIIADDQPTPPLATMTWDDLTIELATNGWFDEMRFYTNTIMFMKDGEIVLKLARPTRQDTSYWLMNQVAHQLPEIANTPKTLQDIPF